jgi:addiction module HigA family antidote
MNNETLWPHPGEILRECLNDLGITASRLSKATHIPASRITEIIKGRRGVSADTALRLGKSLGTTPDYWLNLQQSYDLRCAKRDSLQEVETLVVNQ